MWSKLRLYHFILGLFIGAGSVVLVNCFLRGCTLSEAATTLIFGMAGGALIALAAIILIDRIVGAKQ